MMPTVSAMGYARNLVCKPIWWDMPNCTSISRADARLEKSPINNETSMSVAEKSFAWEPLLRTWGQEWLTSAEYRSVLSDEVIASGWLGYPGASEEQIAS